MKFLSLFIVFGFTFLFITTSLLGSTGLRGFPKSPDSVLRTGSDSPIVWKSTLSTILLPIKIILIGPIALPQIHFLQEDPPPPFIGIYLLIYWSILALISDYLLSYTRFR